MKNVLIAMVVVLFASCAPKSKNNTKDNFNAKVSNELNFDSDSAFSFVEAQVNFGPRVPGTKSHVQCGDYIIDKLRSYNADTIIVQSFDTKNFRGDPMPLRNIMGRYDVDNPDRVLLVAHWDTRPWADNDRQFENRNTPVPGANDGGSGVAVLLEIARHLNDSLPRVGIDLLFVDGEDSGRSDGFGNNDETWCLGTQYWVNHMPYAPDALPRYGILLDMVGGLNAIFYREYVSERNASEINDKVWAVAKAAGYGDRFQNAIRGGVIDDHIFINRAGIPCIDIIECSNPETGSFSPHWHTLNDNLNNINLASLKAAGQTVLNTVYIEK